jgi:hypothetical protein
MTSFQLALGHAGVGLCLLALAGLVAHGRARTCVLFSSYLAALSAVDSFILFAPQRYWTVGFWMFKQALLGVSVEAVYVTFRGSASGRTVAGLVVATVLLVVLLAPFPASGAIAQDHPDVACGALLATALVLAVKRRESTAGPTWAILLGMCAKTWMGVFFRFLRGLAVPSELVAALGPPATLSIVAWWTWNAVRRPPTTGVPS